MERNTDGTAACDCTECAFGWNGDKSCGEGWAESKPGRMGCTRGRLVREGASPTDAVGMTEGAYSRHGPVPRRRTPY